MDYRLLISLDEDDPTLPDYLNILSGIFCTIKVFVSLNKIDAINRDLAEYEEPWDILVNLSDDQVFTKKDFGVDIENAFDGQYNNAAFFPDGTTPIMTMSIMGREYYRNDGYIYHPDYISLWCDNEAHKVALKRGKLLMPPERIFVHLHPANFGDIEQDQQYKDTEAHYWDDQKTYNRRAKNNFED